MTTPRKPMVPSQPERETRPVRGYEGLYSVAEDGRVWSHARVVARSRGGAFLVRGKWLSAQVINTGYPIVNLHRGNGPDRFLVHRLVADAWLPAPLPGQDEVNHKDSDRANPHASNLEWCTRSENHRHAWKHGARRSTERHKAAARRNGKRSLSVDAVRAIRAAAGTQREVAQQFGVSQATISLIHNQRRYAGI